MPQQAPAEWITKFRGAFNHGWDKVSKETLARQKALGVVPKGTVLTARPDYIPDWDSFSPTRRRIMARMMEVYAGMLAYQDAQFGRLIEELKRTGELKNTLIIFMEGDNGATAEAGINCTMDLLGGFANGVHESDDALEARLNDMGGPLSNETYPAGWAWALSAPFQWTKSYASHLGGTRNGMVLSWPEKIRVSGVRSQFHHVTDIALTIFEAVDVPLPTVVNGARQQRMDGISMAYSFAVPKAPGRRHTQYFELIGNRGVYHDGWWAGTTPQIIGYSHNTSTKPVADWPWELYNLDKDFSQSHNLATSKPEKLAELKAIFAQEAERNNVFLLNDEVVQRAVAARVKPRDHYVYWGKDIRVPAEYGPQLTGSFVLSADITTGPDTADGVVAALGGHFAGWSFYLKDGYPVVTMAGSTQAERVFRVRGASGYHPARPACVTLSPPMAAPEPAA